MKVVMKESVEKVHLLYKYNLIRNDGKKSSHYQHFLVS